MSTLTLRPSATGDVNLIPSSTPSEAASLHWNKVDETVADGDTTRIFLDVVNGANDRYDLYNIPNHTSESGTINSVKVYIVCRYDFNDNGYARAYTKIKTGATEYTGSQINLTTSWVTSSTTYSTNPQAGGAWTWAQIDALQIGVRLSGSAVGEGLESLPVCTQVYVEVDYTPSSGFFAFM